MSSDDEAEVVPLQERLDDVTPEAVADAAVARLPPVGVLKQNTTSLMGVRLKEHLGPFSNSLINFSSRKVLKRFGSNPAYTCLQLFLF